MHAVGRERPLSELLEVVIFLFATVDTPSPSSTFPFTESPCNSNHDSPGPRDPLGLPDWNPFANFRATCLRLLILPVPVVFLRFDFSPQLSKSTNISVCSRDIKEILPPTFPDFRRWISARGACVFLNVHRSSSYSVDTISKVREAVVNRNHFVG